MLGRLHVLTDARPGRDALAVTRSALGAGAPLIQVRVEDGTGDRQFLAFAAEVLALCRAHGATCLINDRVDIALALGADGVHLGADDLPVALARRILGPAAIIGATSKTTVDGADYLGVGPVSATAIKPEKAPIGIEGIARSAGELPVIAIGGVTAESVPGLVTAGAHGVAVVGAVSGAADPAEAVRAFLKALA